MEMETCANVALIFN